MSFPFTTIKEWIAFVHGYQKQVVDKKDPSLVKKPEVKKTLSENKPPPSPLFKKLVYKCKWGTACFQASCIYIHPYQKEYETATYYKNNIPCKYETSFTICKNKCSQSDGRYCPFTHCAHTTNKPISTCEKPYCQKHCFLCS